jgi:DNA-binding HxlR family transcriptional regulator
MMTSVGRVVSGYSYDMAEPATAEDTKLAARRESCCSAYHAAIELIGKRWTGAIVFVLLDGPLRFSEVKTLVPDLSDRLLSERLKELEGEGIVERRAGEGVPMRIEYVLTEKGRALEPAVRSLKVWARSWL